ncbi:DEAD/DEAH box helicase [Nocardia sp. NPDC019304]|uniref:DEAD/DEAH box helicase n=1 Tax=unclassified Nocardia TaxID=2637762 RepID=UPI0033EE9CB5
MTTANVTVFGNMLRFTPRRGGDLTDLLRQLRARIGSENVRRDGTGLVAPKYSMMWLLDDDAAASMGVSLDADATRALEVRKRATAYHDRYRQHVICLREGGIQLALRELNARPTGLNLGLLDDHQIVNVAAMTAPEGYGMLLFDEQGAGKTVSVIYAFDRLVDLNLLDTMVVVAPKSMVSEWKSAIGHFMNERYKVEIVEGTPSERARRVDSGADVVVMNYEAVASIRHQLLLRLRRRPDRALLVVDESFAIKNPQARRTQDLQSIRDWFARVWLLCGTPAPNTAHDIVAQVSMVDFGATFADVTIPKDRTEAVPVVRQALDARAIYLRNLKTEVLPDLPQRSFTRLTIPLSPIQAQLYAAALDTLIEDVEALDDKQFLKQIGTYLARRMALLRIASNPAGMFDNYSEVPGKLAALDELVTRLIDHDGEKLVVWSCFTASLEAIVQRYQRFGVVRYDGSVTSITDRRDAVQRFQSDPTVRMFVANPAAAGAGLTLHAARYAVYESFTNQAAQYLQSLDRIHRRGQEREVEYFVLLGAHTIETAEFDKLVLKQERAHELLGDVVPEQVVRTQFLAELRASKHVQAETVRP